MLISLRNKANAFDLKDKSLKDINSKSDFSEEKKKELRDKVTTLLDEACTYGTTNEGYDEITRKLNIIMEGNDDENSSKDENTSKNENLSIQEYIINNLNLMNIFIIYSMVILFLVLPLIVRTMLILGLIAAILNENISKNQENESKNQPKPHSFSNGSLRSMPILVGVQREKISPLYTLILLILNCTFVCFIYFTMFKNNILCDAPRA